MLKRREPPAPHQVPHPHAPQQNPRRRHASRTSSLHRRDSSRLSPQSSPSGCAVEYPRSFRLVKDRFSVRCDHPRTSPVPQLHPSTVNVDPYSQAPITSLAPPDTLHVLLTQYCPSCSICHEQILSANRSRRDPNGRDSDPSPKLQPRQSPLWSTFPVPCRWLTTGPLRFHH